jgi:transposase-like protein
MDVVTIYDQFPTEQAFIEHFIELRFGSVDPACLHCGSVNVQRETDRKFRCRDCRRKFSVLSGTLFERTKIDLRKWYYALIKATTNARKGISSHELGRDLNIRQATAWKMLTKIREAMKKANGLEEKLALIVECDETFVGGKPRKANCKWINLKESVKTPVVVMTERPAEDRPGKSKVFVPDPDHKGRRLTQPVMTDLIEENVDIDRSEIHTDQSPLYAELKSRGVLHESVPHYRHYVDPSGHVHCNTSESFNALVKRSHYGIHHKYAPENVHLYAEETSYRWNHRYELHRGMDRVMELAMVNERRTARKSEQWPPAMNAGDDGQLLLF